MSKKAKIADIVPANVTVGEPKIVEIHQKLGGGQALPGSPAGPEAQPHPQAEGFVPGVDG